MKTFLVAAALFIGANALTKEQYETIMKKVQKVGGECVEKEHATPADLAELVAHKIPPSTHSGKCIIACFYEHFEMMKPDGTFDKDATIKAFDEIKDMDAELHGKILKMIDTCDGKKQITDDRCETASLMATCVKTEADGLGISREAFLASD